MIIIDGREIDKQISSFSNLEELLADLMADDDMKDRVVTDVFVNDENFSEIYPHQAEDMSCDNIRKVEIRSTPNKEMAVDVAGEMDKVAKMMLGASKSISQLFREGKDSDALELLQDLLDVTRDFMGLLGHLRGQYLGGADAKFAEKVEGFSNLISEMSEVLENEDWILLADLLEFEFAPYCEYWRDNSRTLHHQLEACAG